MKKGLKKLSVIILMLTICLTAVPMMQVQAAERKAAEVSFTFNGIDDEVEPDRSWNTNNHTLFSTVSAKPVALKGVKLGGEVYIPQAVLEKKGSRIAISMAMDIFGNKKSMVPGGSNHVSWVSANYNFTLRNEDGKIAVTGFDDAKQKDLKKAGSYLTCKKGSGKYKSFYVITLKNIPISDTYYDIGKQVKFTKKNKFKFNVTFSVCGTNSKSSGKFYVTKLTATVGKKVIASQNFSKKPAYFNAMSQFKDMKKSKYKIVKF